MEHVNMKHNPPAMGRCACLRNSDKSPLKTDNHTKAENTWVLKKFTV